MSLVDNRCQILLGQGVNIAKLKPLIILLNNFLIGPMNLLQRGYFNITLKYTFKLMSFLTLHCIKIVKNLSNMSFRNSVLCFFVAFC